MSHKGFHKAAEAKEGGETRADPTKCKCVCECVYICVQQVYINALLVPARLTGKTTQGCNRCCCLISR